MRYEVYWRSQTGERYLMSSWDSLDEAKIFVRPNWRIYDSETLQWVK